MDSTTLNDESINFIPAQEPTLEPQVHSHLEILDNSTEQVAVSIPISDSLIKILDLTATATLDTTLDTIPDTMLTAETDMNTIQKAVVDALNIIPLNARDDSDADSGAENSCLEYSDVEHTELGILSQLNNVNMSNGLNTLNIFTEVLDTPTNRNTVFEQPIDYSESLPAITIADEIVMINNSNHTHSNHSIVGSHPDVSDLVSADFNHSIDATEMKEMNTILNEHRFFGNSKVINETILDFTTDPATIGKLHKSTLQNKLKPDIKKRVTILNSQPLTTTFNDTQIPLTSNIITQDDVNHIRLVSSINGENQHISDVNSMNTPSDFSYTNQIRRTSITNDNKNMRHFRSQKLKKKTNMELDGLDHTYNRLQDYIRNITIDRTNFALIITKACEIVENITETSTLSRKELVVKTINRIVLIDLVLSEFDQKFILANIENYVELIILSTNTKHARSQRKTNCTDIDDITRATSGQIIYSLLDKLITIIVKKRYTIEKIFTNIGTLAILLMTFCEKYNYLIGVEKKNIVIHTLYLLISTKLEYITELTPIKKTELINALDAIPLSIDIFIALQKGKYRINKKMSMPSGKLFSGFFCCGNKNNVEL